GFFPADNPQYSCIVVVNHPDKSIGFYGTQVAAPAFKEIAEKIYTRTPQTDTIKSLYVNQLKIKDGFKNYYGLAQKEKPVVPNVIGLPAMDAVPLLENLGVEINLRGRGMVYNQSVPAGRPLQNVKKINLAAR